MDAAHAKELTQPPTALPGPQSKLQAGAAHPYVSQGGCQGHQDPASEVGYAPHWKGLEQNL